MKIAVVGSFSVRMTVTVPRVPRSGESLNGATFNLGPGGKGSNQAIGAARLGAEVSLLAAVGDDTFGEQARALWSAEGIRHSHVVTGNTATMVSFIIVEPSGENRVVIAPGALDELTPEHVFEFSSELEAADVVIVSLDIPLAAAIEALRIAHKSGTTTVLDPAPAHPLPPKVWGWVDVLTPNLSEARVLAGVNPDSNSEIEPSQLVEALRSRYNGGIVLTLGGDGAVVDDGERRADLAPTTPRRVVDATGAGDAFTAALAAVYGRGDSLESAARYAVAAGAWAVGVPQAVPALPYPDDIDSLLSKEHSN